MPPSMELGLCWVSIRLMATCIRSRMPAEPSALQSGTTVSPTDLEMLAVVWAISHFHHFLYGHIVTITDHTAVKSVLEAPNPAGKHTRWWTRVYGRGLKDVTIVYRAGKENKNADALSWSPVLPAPQVGLAEEEVQYKSPRWSLPRARTMIDRNLVRPLGPIASWLPISPSVNAH